MQIFPKPKVALGKDPLYAILGCFGLSGSQRKKIQSAISMLLLSSVFYVVIAKKTLYFTYLLIKSSVRVLFTIRLPQNDEHLWRGRLLCFSGFSLYVCCWSLGTLFRFRCRLVLILAHSIYFYSLNMKINFRQQNVQIFV